MLTHAALQFVSLEHDVEEVTVVERSPLEPLCNSCRNRTEPVTSDTDLAFIPRILWPCVRVGNFSYCATIKRVAYDDGEADEAASEAARKAVILSWRK